MRALTRRACAGGAGVIATAVLSAAMGLLGRIDAASPADTSWRIQSTIDSRQTTDTSGGTTTTTETVHDTSHQTSSEGEQIDDSQTFHQGADGTSYDNQSIHDTKPDGSTASNTADDYRDPNGNRTINTRDVVVDKDGNRTTTSTTDQYDSQGHLTGHREDTTHDKVEPPKPPRPSEPEKREEKTGPEPPARGTSPPQPPGRVPPARPESSGSGSSSPPAGNGSGAHQVVLTVHEECTSTSTGDVPEIVDRQQVSGTYDERDVYRFTKLEGEPSDLEEVSHQGNGSVKGSGTYQIPLAKMSYSWTYGPSDDLGEALHRRVIIDLVEGWLQLYVAENPCNRVKASGCEDDRCRYLADLESGDIFSDRDPRLRYTFAPGSKSIFAHGHASAQGNRAGIPGEVERREVDYSVSVGGAGAATPAAAPGPVVPDGEVFPMVIDQPGRPARVGLPLMAGKKVTVRAVGNTIGAVRVRLLGPDGGELTAGSSSAGSFTLSTATAATSGTYTIVVESTSGSVGRIGIGVTSQ